MHIYWKAYVPENVYEDNFGPKCFTGDYKLCGIGGGGGVSFMSSSTIKIVTRIDKT